MLGKLNVICIKNWKNILLLALILLAAIFLIYIYTDMASVNSNIPKNGSSVIDVRPHEDYSQLSPESQESLSESYASITPNEVEWTSEEEGLDKGIFCITTESTDYMLYNIDSNNIAGLSKTFADFDNIWIDSHSDRFYAVLNISGKNIDLKDYYVLVRDDTGLYGSRAVLNFYEAETVNLTDAIITGTVLAPNADIICEGTTIYGQVHGSSITGEMKYYRDMRFTGYRDIVENLDVLNIVNDPVRIAAIQYLVNNDPGDMYSDYTLSSNIRSTDAPSVKRLNINAQGQTLTSLSEDIAKFPNLEEIIINGGEFDSLSLSSAVNLKLLSVTGTTVSSLDISALTELERLILDRNTELKTLDFTNNKHIQVLSYSGTPLGWMDYTPLTELYYLDCSRSEVGEYLTITGDTLPNIRMLDISGNSNILTFYMWTFPKLESLNCSSCNITELDFSESKALVYFKGSYNMVRNINFQGAVNLKYIEAYGSAVESIDIRGLTPEIVYCTANKITE